MTLAYDREYRYRRMFSGLTHDQYEDEPLGTIEWMLRIHEIREPKQKPDPRERGA